MTWVLIQHADEEAESYRAGVSIKRQKGEYSHGKENRKTATSLSKDTPNTALSPIDS